MTSKKSDKANLEKHRTAFFHLGLVVALSVSLLAFEWVSPVLEKHEFKGKLKVEEAPYIISEIIPKKETQKQQQSQQKNNKPSDEIIVDSVDRTNETKDLPKDIQIPDGPILESNKVQNEVIIETGLNTGTFSISDVDVMPEFPGGREALQEFLAKNTKYPHQARERNVEGVVKVSFVVDENGKVTDVNIKNDIGYNCGKEAMCVVNSMPQWKPAKIGGKAVPVYYEVKINFLLK